jgi:hypothetical protein
MIAALGVAWRPVSVRTWSGKASLRRSQTPAMRHRLKQSHTVDHGGKSRGRRRQAQPLRTT